MRKETLEIIWDAIVCNDKSCTECPYLYREPEHNFSECTLVAMSDVSPEDCPDYEHILESLLSSGELKEGE